MPTRKQRRRQQKSRRHDWEYVYVDDEGNEVDVDESELTPKPAKQDRPRAGNRRNGKAQAAKVRRPRRTPQPPSWSRAIKRSAILGALFVVLFAFGFGKNSNVAVALLIGIVYATAFVPLQYLIDRITYRAFLRRQAAAKRS